MKFRSSSRSRALPWTLAFAVLISTSPMVTSCSRGDDQPAAAPSTQSAPSVAAPAPMAAPAPETELEPAPPPGGASPQELQELVSPIALYPDPLVAQILAGSTYPTQVVDADRWLKQNPNLTGDALAAQVNQQPWDPSIKSLTQFPSVLDTMNNSLAWTSSLGEAYYNQPADVMNAIQVMRNMAVNAGTLKSTPQQVVQLQPAPPAESGGQPSMQQTVIIQPAQPNTVYVPQYNPTSAYGAPVAAPAGYSGSDLLLTGVLSFGAGILLGSLINNGHNNWGCGWYGGGGSSVRYNNNVYVTNNNVYPGRGPGYRPPNNNYPRPGYPDRTKPSPGNRPPYNGGGNRPERPNGPNNPNRPDFPSRPNGSNPSTLPATRPYDPKNARPYNPDKQKPNFPNNPGGGKENGKLGQKNRPSQQPATRPNQQPANRPNQPNNPSAGNRPATKPANRPAEPTRGFAKDRSSTGGRNGALGGYEPGGNARAASGRGQSSLKGNQNGGGARANGGGGGNAKRGRGGGGGNQGGRKKK
jgi:hypothetical protein